MSARFSSCAVAVAVMVAGSQPLPADVADMPVTVAEAAKLLDLATIPLVESSAKPGRRTLAGLTYEAPASVAAAFEFHRKELAKRGFTELPGRYVSDQSASGTFARDGAKVSLTVYPSGTPGKAAVTVSQHGNVDLAKLPLPQGAKPSFSGPVSAMFLTDTPLGPARDECRKQLLDRGWEAYGEAGDTLFFRKNAVRLTAFVTAAPAQGNRTMLTYSAELMSVELPAPPTAVQVHYSDSPTQLAFDFPGTMPELTAYYAKALAPAGWKATTDKPIQIEIYDELIYRNPQKELLTLRMHDFEGKIRGLLRFQTAAEVVELDRLADAERKKRATGKPAGSRPILTLAIPAGAGNVKTAKDRITFTVATGKAKTTVERLATELTKQGWTGDVATLENLAGAVSLSKEQGTVTIDYTDTGFLPAEITVDAIGVELQRGQ